MTNLPKVQAGSPIKTNACINREAAIKAFKAGVTAAHIAEYWPEVWQLTEEGKITQKYDYELADGSGRFETKRMILPSSVRGIIKKYGKKGAK